MPGMAVIEKSDNFCSSHSRIPEVIFYFPSLDKGCSI
jgi:hypothetical protein